MNRRNLDLQQRYALLLLVLFVFIHGANAVCYSGLSPLSPYVESDVGMSKAQLGGLISAVSVGAACTSFFTGWLVDIYGVRVVLSLCQVGVAGGMIALTSFHSYLGMYLSVCVIGMSYSAINHCTNKGVAIYLPADFRATAMGFKQMGVACGSAIAAAVLPNMAEKVGWRWPIVAVAGLILLLSVITALTYREKDHQAHSSFCIKDVATLLQDRKYYLIGYCGMVNHGVQLAVLAYFVVYCCDVLLLTPIRAGQLMSLALLAGAVGRVGWGAISDRLFHGNRPIVSALVALLCILSTLALNKCTAETSWIILALVSIFIGLTSIGWNGLMMALIVEKAKPEKIGITSGFCLTMNHCGFFIPPLFGWICDQTGGYNLSWYYICALLFTVFLVFLLWALRDRAAAAR